MRPGRTSRALLPALAAVCVLLLAAAPSALAGAITPESGGSPNADNIDTLYRIALYVAIVIFLIVEGTLIWSLVKFRARRGGPEPKQIRGNTPLELSWTAGAALILVVLTVVTFLYLGDIETPPESDPDGLAQGVQVASIDQPKPPGPRKSLNIDVNGQQYLWRYDYPGDDLYSYYKLVVPTKTTVTLSVTSSDVIHSWWIPKLGGKVDGVPGHKNETWFKIDKPGLYTGVCAELCGEGHADMRAAVRAVSPADYEAWVAKQRQAIKAAQQGLADQRRRRQEEGS